MFAVVALLLIACAGCKSESSSPTSPTTTQPPTSTSGGTTPPVSPTVVVTVSNANPVTNSTSIITATVTVNGQPVPNGTAVEFATTTPGSFTESGTQSLLRTTTSGVATATLTSDTAATVPVSVTVNNVTKSVNVKFSDQVVIQPPNTTMTVTGISPSTGKPQGGDQVTITGTNFKAPARVLFDTGTGSPKEAFVVSVTPTAIVVVTPAVDLGPSAQTLPATVTVISSAGNPDEQRAVSPVKFTYALQVLTPIITTVTPNSGPIDGGTRVTIVGEAFQQPVQVFFGAAEAQIVSINFNQIIAISPVGSSTAPGGSGPVTGFVDVTVLNMSSNKRASLTNAFRYVPKAVITAITPSEGPFTGGTRVTVDGNGFNDPVTVQFAGIAASVIKVSGSQIIAITGGIKPTGCADIPGPTTMNNVDNGDAAIGPTWIYRIIKPTIISVTNATQGGTTQVTVANPGASPRFTIGGKLAQIISATTNANGTVTFTLQVPTTLVLTTTACQGGGNAPQPTSFDVVYTDLITTCTDTGPGALTVSPPVGPALSVVGAFGPFIATITPGNPSATPPTSPTVTNPPSQTVTIVDTGNTSPLTGTISAAGPDCASSFTFSPNINAGPFSFSLNQCENQPLTVSFSGTTAPSSKSCTVTVTTNAGTKTFSLSGTSH